MDGYRPSGPAEEVLSTRLIAPRTSEIEMRGDGGRLVYGEAQS